MMIIRMQDELPRYVQVKQWVERQIVCGRWRPGDVLPPERELAAQLQVSPLTVSRALQWLAREGVLIRKRRVGTVVVQELPPHLLQSAVTLLVLGTGVATRQSADFYFGVLHRRIHAELAAQSIRTLWLDYCFDVVERELRSAEIVGVLAIAPAAEHIPLLEWLYARGVPVVVVGASAEGWTLPYVDSDNYRAAHEGVRFLLEQGHRRFVGLFAALETFNSRDRWRGFRDALQQAGIPSEQIWTFITPYADEFDDAVRDGLSTLIRLPSGPTAVFAGGYYLALAALQTAYGVGCAVPQRLSVLGFDDPPSAALTVPPLTTFRQPLDEMGARAVQKMLQLIRGQSPEPLQERLPLELVVRESVAPACSDGEPDHRQGV
jgi:DNA-binding LacI/PurR family transcriptional regulator/DNA-binding transcriptional regulator YhcF (GntR family)